MVQPADKQHKSEIERMVDLDKMGAGGSTALEVTPSESERAALARRFGFLGLPAFSARATVDRRAGGQVVVEGRLRGRIVQACILSLDPVTQELDETFRIAFKQDLAEVDAENGRRYSALRSTPLSRWPEICSMSAKSSPNSSRWQPIPIPGALA